MAIDLDEIRRLWNAGKFRDDHLGALICEIERLKDENDNLDAGLDDAINHPQCGCYD